MEESPRIVAKIPNLPDLVVLDRAHLEGQHTEIDAYACLVLSNNGRIHCIAKQLIPIMLQDVCDVVHAARELGTIA